MTEYGAVALATPATSKPPSPGRCRLRHQRRVVDVRSGARDPQCKESSSYDERTNPDTASPTNSDRKYSSRSTPRRDVVRSTGVRLGFGTATLRDRLPASGSPRPQPARRRGRRIRHSPGPAGGPGVSTTACVRLGAAERALALMVNRVRSRVAFGRRWPNRASCNGRFAQSRSKSTRRAAVRRRGRRPAWQQRGAHLVAMIKAVAPRVARCHRPRNQVTGPRHRHDDTR